MVGAARGKSLLVGRLGITTLLVLSLIPLVAWAQTAPSDVQGHWAEQRILSLLQRGIITVLPDTTFHPDEEVTRGEFIQWLVVARGFPPRPVRVPTFSDVPATHPFSAYIEAALAAGLIPRSASFMPAAPIRRSDAVVLTVQAMGYAVEAVILSRHVTVNEEVGALPDHERGSMAIAMFGVPPLLREPALPARPNAMMTRAEASSLLWAMMSAAEAGFTLQISSAVASGLNLIIEKRGVLRARPIWRIQIGAFTTEEGAQRLASAMRERGWPSFVELQDGLYKVRVGNFTSAIEAGLAKEQLSTEGFPAWVIATIPEVEALPGPFRTAVIVVDPRSGFRLVPATGDGQRMQLQRTSDLARRTGAAAAINGGFFSSTGDPLGCLMIEGEILSEPDPRRTCAGLDENGAVLFDYIRLEATVASGEVTARIDGANRLRRADELIVYSPRFDLFTRTNQFGAEAIVSGGIVATIRDLRGNSQIPRDGVVLSGHGRARQWILQNLPPGAPVAVTTNITPASGDSRWTTVRSMIGGGPRLLAAGQFVGGEGFTAAFSNRRHPRSAIGVLADGRVVLVTIYGRQPYHSVGMTLLEFAMELRRIGVVDAMNLDGGGSTTLVVGGQVVNLPADETGERPVGDALMVVPVTGTR
ncbi:MAG: phosphodiester glycosidase family protein [bacterium]